MPTILYTGKTTLDFEAFPRGCERSVVGCLRLRVRRSIDVTDGELAALRSAGVPLRDVTAREKKASPPVEWNEAAAVVTSPVGDAPIGELPPPEEKPKKRARWA